MPGGFGVRVDTSIYPGVEISPDYDSMIAKLIVHGTNKSDCIQKMRRSLEEFVIDGVRTNIDFHYFIFHEQVYKNGLFDVGFIDHILKELEANE